MLTSCVTVTQEKRRSVLYLLDNYVEDIIKTREIEASIHCISRTLSDYIDKAQQIIQNIKQNRTLIHKGADLVVMTNKDMAANTIIEDIEKETDLQKKRFEQMLQEKYDMMNDKSYNATLKCRRCGSSEVSWDQKQTRSADEASTVFCTCTKCNNRWTMR